MGVVGGLERVVEFLFRSSMSQMIDRTVLNLLAKKIISITDQSPPGNLQVRWRVKRN